MRPVIILFTAFLFMACETTKTDSAATMEEPLKEVAPMASGEMDGMDGMKEEAPVAEPAKAEPAKKEQGKKGKGGKECAKLKGKASKDCHKKK